MQPELLKKYGGSSSDDKWYLVSLSSSIDNIVNSYDGYFDQLTEMVQNGLDALETKWLESNKRGIEYEPRLTIEIDQQLYSITVIDNGTGVDEENFDLVFTPNISVKQHLGHENARGHKGAAMVYLQFDHKSFEFQSKRGEFKRRFKIKNGVEWRKNLEDSLKEGIPGSTPLLDFEEDARISDKLEAFESGSISQVIISGEDKVPLFEAIFAKHANDAGKKVALKRLEYLLRTRTGVGLVADSDKVGAFWKALKVELKATFLDKAEKIEPIEVGFLYPHLLHSQVARFLSPKRTELLYEYISDSFVKIREELKTGIYAVSAHKSILEKYKVDGYVSYVNRNTLYEELLKSFCSLDTKDILDEKEEKLLDYLTTTGVNGGFIVAVDGFPNGTLQPFLQRGGSEDKSRTFVIMNFHKPYKPDYGRKNLAHDCRAFANTLCKELMRASRELKSRYMVVDGGAAIHGANELPAAREALKLSLRELHKRFPEAPIKTNADFLNFHPQHEPEVVLMFVELVRRGILKGYEIYGIPNGLMLDGLFDYKLEASQETIYNEASCPLGLVFGGLQNKEYTDNWLEYKLASDQLIDNLDTDPGKPSKKYFDTIDLLICFDVDDQTEGYSLDKVTIDNSSKRRFYGVTHLLTKRDNEHVIQVIGLKTLFDYMGR